MPYILLSLTFKKIAVHLLAYKPIDNDFIGVRQELHQKYKAY